MDSGAAAKSASSMRRPRLMLGLPPIVLLLTVGLAGCAAPIAVRPPTATEIDRVKEHQLAIALFQLRGSIDGKAVSPLNPGDSNNFFRIYLANLDELGAPKQIRPALLSEGAADGDWRYLLLPPGVYYLLVLPPGVEQNPPAVAYSGRSARYGRLTQYKFEPGRGGFWSPELMAWVLAGEPPRDFRELQGFWFQVPENDEVVYLGSLYTECRNGRGLGRLIDSCHDYDFANDPEAAKQAVASSLPGLTFDVLPLVPYGKPRAGTRLKELDAVNIVARAPTIIAPAFTGSEMTPSGVIHGTGQPIVVYNLLAVGFESAARAAATKRAEDRVVEAQPCIDRLSHALDSINYSSRFVSELGQATRERGIVLDLSSAAQTPEAPKTESARYRLTTSLPILRLREVGQPQYLALELALELRLEAVDSKTLSYYNILYYAPDLPIESPLAPHSPLYAQFVPQRAKSRPIAEWCGADGTALFEEEISVALTQIAAQVARDLID